MEDEVTPGWQSEAQFAALVESVVARPDRHARLIDLLHEDHPLYDQRGAATTVRMRGWILLALARVGVSETALPFVLEELDTGVDAYLVAAAARALRAYPKPTAALAPFVMRAITNIRYRDEPVSFAQYGEYAVAATGTSPVRELLATLAWLGPHALGSLRDAEALRAQPGRLSRMALDDLDLAIATIRGADSAGALDLDACCTLPALGNVFWWALGARRECEPIDATIFEDQDGAALAFKEFFRGHPAIVVFFYTRCDNPLKCSLTVTKLARIHRLLEARELVGQIRTAAITYDPAFDLPERLRRYGLARGVRLDADHRLLRATDGIAALAAHFRLGVNFIESLVNRHRIELYILDAAGRIAASFERIHWDEQEVVDRAVDLLNETHQQPTQEAPMLTETRDVRAAALPVLGTLASVGVAFFPKCPVCWAAYLSMLGVAGVESIPHVPWLRPLLVIAMLLNLSSVWLRARSTGRPGGLYLAGMGALAILVSQLISSWESAAGWGVALTVAGSLASVLENRTGRVLFLRHLDS